MSGGGDDGVAMVRGADPRGPAPVGADVHVAGDLDELDAAVREGRVRRVVFADAGDLWRGIWDGQIAFDQWLARGAAIEFDGAGPRPAMDDVRAAYALWQEWDRARRRRQVTAAVILSGLAIALGCMANLLIPAAG